MTQERIDAERRAYEYLCKMLGLYLEGETDPDTVKAAMRYRQALDDTFAPYRGAVANLSRIDRAILTAMETAEPGRGMETEIAERIGTDPPYICLRLKRLIASGRVEQTARGVYRLRTAKGTLTERVDSIRATLRGCG